MNIDRRLATVRRISKIRPIEGADNIELATVDGWNVVVKKGEYHVGQLAIYFEIDSWIPIELAPFLRSPGHPDRFFRGVNGERLKTRKLRGQISQGLLLPSNNKQHTRYPHVEGEDLTQELGVRKWERPIPAQLAGTVKGNFPDFLRRTDRERIQNVYKYVSNEIGLWEITEKLDGSSMTVYRHQKQIDGVAEVGVCSRNLDLKWDDQNAFWRAAIKQDLINKLTSTGRNLALQGELISPNIQGNPYGLTEAKFYLFDIFDIDEQRYLSPTERGVVCTTLGIEQVPCIGYASLCKESMKGVLVDVKSLADILAYAEDKSLLNNKVEREGVVYKHLDKQVSFKAISNKWLLKEKE